ncbi:MAG: metallophosphoesterase, partial [Deltaproteobacteria bacterium]|nr:metallophosphoesterase [Deltaproteobacteria bacterium]
MRDYILARKKRVILLAVLVLTALLSPLVYFKAREAITWRGCLAAPRLESSGLESPGLESPEIATAHPGRTRFAALGDSGTGDGQQARVARAVAGQCRPGEDGTPGCDFLLLLGDNFYPRGVQGVDDPLFGRMYEDMYGSLGIPVLTILGNHDIRGDAAAQVLYSGHSATWRMPDFRYEFKAGPARFFARNSNCDHLDMGGLAHRLDELEGDRSDGSPWRFVLAHHSPYSTGGHGDLSWALGAYWEARLAGRADFHLSGHNHILEHLQRE